MRRVAPVRTEYGMVDLELVLCDNPECKELKQEAHCIEWIHVSYFGRDDKTLGVNYVQLNNTDFCSVDCLKKVLN